MRRVTERYCLEWSKHVASVATRAINNRKAAAVHSGLIQGWVRRVQSPIG